jgi:SAM-dependent methyltransferase
VSARLPRIGDDDFYDAELHRLRPHLRAAAAVRPGDRVLDIGCGTGQTARDAARDAPGGHVAGVDRSAPMLRRARRLTRRAGLRSVRYVHADAQRHRFPPGRFDVALSRFGVMFFADPPAAFANVARALRPGARLALMVWQAPEHNAWVAAFRGALAPGATPSAAGGAFSLADPAVTRPLLAGAGFSGITFTDVREPVYYGPDRDAAVGAVLSLREPRDLLAAQDGRAARRAGRRLRDLLAAHETPGGVFLDARSWIVTATLGPPA